MRRREEIQSKGNAGSVARGRIVEQFRRSGLTARAFASKTGLSVWTLYRWSQRDQKARAASGDTRLPFVEVLPDSANAHATSPSPSVIVVFSSGARVEFFASGAARLETAVARILERC